MVGHVVQPITDARLCETTRIPGTERVAEF